MARWTPKDNEPVGVSEHIGRRLFDEPKLSGAPDQRPFKGLELRHFEETRDREFSVDRLGASSVDKAVERYLSSRCLCEAEKHKKPKRFDGWAYIVVRKLTTGTNWLVYPSPIRRRNDAGAEINWSDENLDQNLYHAHILRPEDMSPAFFAYQVREKFLTLGDVRRARQIEQSGWWRATALWNSLKAMLRALLGK